MKTYVKFIIFVFLKSFLNIFFIVFGLVLILNLLSELDFFKEIKISTYFPIYLSILNSMPLIFEMFPFIFLICSQFFFINFFKNNELEVFKYSGLKNTEIIKILSMLTFFMGILIVVFFYNISSNFKKFYLELKSNYTSDNKYLAVITNNGLWIKDKIENKILIINSVKIETNHLVDTFISEFDNDYKLIRNIKSKKINVKDNIWIIKKAEIFINNEAFFEDELKLKSNFNYERIQSLFSNLSSLSIIELFELKKNYKLLGYSTIEVDVQIQKLLSSPIYFLLMTVFASIVMYNSKSLKLTSFKITIGLFSSVLIYYINNFFYVLGNTERIPLIVSVWLPLLILGAINTFMLRNINEK